MLALAHDVDDAVAVDIRRQFSAQLPLGRREGDAAQCPVNRSDNPQKRAAMRAAGVSFEQDRGSFLGIRQGDRSGPLSIVHPWAVIYADTVWGKAVDLHDDRIGKAIVVVQPRDLNPSRSLPIGYLG